MGKGKMEGKGRESSVAEPLKRGKEKGGTEKEEANFIQTEEVRKKNIITKE